MRNNMRKAKIQLNNTLLEIPNQYDGWGNFPNASVELQQSYGFYEVINPTLTEDKMCGNPYLDEENKVITFYIVDKPIVPPIPPIEPTINIDTRKIKSEIGELFEPRGFEFQNNYPMIMDNLKDAPIPMYRKNMENLKKYSVGYRLSGIITEVEYNAFLQIFIDNGFNLNDY
jgi:hypothetical protein